MAASACRPCRRTCCAACSPLPSPSARVRWRGSCRWGRCVARGLRRAALAGRCWRAGPATAAAAVQVQDSMVQVAELEKQARMGQASPAKLSSQQDEEAACWLRGAPCAETHWCIALLARSQSPQPRPARLQAPTPMVNVLPQRPWALGPCCGMAARPQLAAAALARRRVAPQCSSSAGNPAAWQQQPAQQRHPLVQRLAGAVQRAAAAVQAQRAAASAALAR